MMRPSQRPFRRQLVGASFALAALAACTQKTTPTELDAEQCIADPAPTSSGQRGPFPFEGCAPELSQPLAKLDQDATARRRARDPKACCYRRAPPP